MRNIKRSHTQLIMYKYSFLFNLIYVFQLPVRDVGRRGTLLSTSIGGKIILLDVLLELGVDSFCALTLALAR